MATSTASGYGTYAPAAIDPFPIESVLAKIVGENNPAEAANMLDTYQVQNQTSQGNYNYAMGQQHDFAKQALSQQLYEAKLKEMAPLLNAPGGAHLLGQGGIPGMGMDTDPGVMQGVVAAADAAQQAKAFGEAGKGAEGFSNAGYMVGANAIPGLPPNAPVTQTENARLAAERIRANAILGAAAMRGTKEPLVTVSGQSAPNAYGEVTTTSHRVPENKVEAEQAAIEARNQAIRDRRAGNAPAGPGVGGGSGSTLPPAQQNTPANKPSGTTQATPQPQKLDTNSPNGKMAQGGATIAMDRANKDPDPRAKAMVADVQRGMQGAAYNTHMTSDGKMWVKGGSGHFYPIQN